ncbi:MAG: aldose 1-epimerase [Actinomycetota bacterium]
MKLVSATAEATVDLEGGRLASLIVGGHELLVAEGEKPTRWGSFPMIPWCGRLPYGRLAFDGQEYEFPLTSPPHANHGRSHLQPWYEVEPGVIRTALGEPWPFGGYAVQRFELGPASLSITAEVRADHHAMPAMLGWHPWFRRMIGPGPVAELQISGGRVYAVNDDLIPTGVLEPVPHPPWNACFVGLDADPVIEWPGLLRLTVSSDLDHWVIFTEPEHALCIEPQSGPPNEFHMAPRVLQPGEFLSGTMTLSWELPARP